MGSSEIWPPPPDISPPVQKKVKETWFRPAFWLALVFNALSCFPAVQLLQYPSGSEMGCDDIDAAPLFLEVLPAAALALFIGIPFAVWQIRKRRKQGKSILWESVGLLLCLSPLFTGLSMALTVVKAKAFVSLA